MQSTVASSKRSSLPCFHKLRSSRKPAVLLQASSAMSRFLAGFNKMDQQSTTFFADTAPSWLHLEDMVRAKMSEFGVNFWEDPSKIAPTNATSLIRTFGQPESSIRVKLYRDHSAWCPYCHKVWLQLEEKKIPYTIEKINMRCYGDKPKSFMSKVPGGMLPVIELDGRVVTESNVIMSLLEEKFPEHRPLMPPKGTRERLRAEALMKLERQFFSDWLGWLCNGWDDAGNRRKFESTLTLVSKEMEAVGGGPYFMGQDISLVDITFTPMLERAAASLAYYKGYYMRGQGRWPAIDSPLLL
ncbi:hypothetical protein CEUSTIGMA_g4621.t1 [Chlamydomonas eustigma]|uniref:GST N-terminal domain-containing protein n=1 Tax=Chlamydomonas eustigma TaxID=1157962 RepID=A0A250X297_9CHLO|nr:hypothetical protein CEUSTIGMA_g4621.t1 [Chlamydomonas eustigma]|eukprot:GAX77176.1 hypothetical protein CEUSTIGMA_g4621.t1 [Chlamydomonas eustigma]